MDKPKFDFDDILVVPEVHSPISSRYKDITLPNVLPLFTAPMDTVVDLNNKNVFTENGINVVLPRTVKYFDYLNHRTIIDEINTEHNIFISFGFADLDNFKKFKYDGLFVNAKILIDVANGHQEKIMEYCKEIKQYRPDITIMVGNIANPETYKWYAENDCVDYIRIGIGNGGGCWLDGTKVLTDKGYVNIEDLDLDDLVLTHDGTYQKIISKISYASNENLIEINGEICTESHEIYVANKIDIPQINDENYQEFCFWLPAKNIDESLHVIVGWGNE
jgi:hypothetical protein